jgi:DNA ligase (NAD+)
VTNKEERIAALSAKRDEASQAYYSGESVISDDEFDLIVAELDSLGVDEEEAGVGHGYVPEGKIAHKERMLSLRKVFAAEDIEEFVKNSEARKYTVELKYDGGAASVIYGVDGYFERAVTRGNGIYGEDITPAIRELISAGKLPDSIDTGRVRTEVRGEVIVTHENFEKLNNSPLGGDYSNPRNTATGIIRRKNVTGIGEFVDFVTYGGDLPTWQLEEEGFLTSIEHFFETVKEDHAASIMALITRLETERKDFGFDSDGVVIKVGDQPTRDALGESSTSPNWAVAFKFKSEVKQTVLHAVEWSTGRTGRIVPVAVFEPIKLGVDVARATLHNATFLQEMDIKINDTIDVQRSNEVIPYVIGRNGDHSPDAVDIAIPDACPTCGSPIYFKNKDIVCSVGGCDPVTIITYGLGQLGVLGVSSVLVGKLVAAGIVKDLVDMLGVTPAQITELDRQGTVSANKAVKAIQDAIKGATVAKWFAALGIARASLSTATQLAERFHTLGGIAQASEEDLLAIPRFGGTKAKSVIAAQERIERTERELYVRYGYKPVEAERVVVPNASPFIGLNLVMTGKFPTFGRTQAADEAKKLGANVQSSVSKTTDLVVAGEDAGSKLQKAASLGIKVMDAADFEATARELVSKPNTNDSVVNTDNTLSALFD